MPGSVRGLDFGRLAHGFPALAERAGSGVFNLGVMSLDKLAVWCADDNRRFPMMGLAKAPVAAAALAEVDAGRLRLNDTIRIGDMDLSPPPGRINPVFPSRTAGIELPAADLIALAIQEGDNTAADAIMGRIGGPGAVTAWLQGHNIRDMRVDRYQREALTELFGMESFHPAWKDVAGWAAARSSVAPELREAARARFLADPRDTTSAQGALNFLNQLSGGDLLSRASTRFLLSLMGAARGSAALRSGLPASATLAQANASSPTDLGVTAIANDMGLVTLPDGRRFAIATFLAESTATATQRGALVADATHLAVSALR
jgi:beta-lactamase class A